MLVLEKGKQLLYYFVFNGLTCETSLWSLSLLKSEIMCVVQIIGGRDIYNGRVLTLSSSYPQMGHEQMVPRKVLVVLPLQ